MRPNAAAASARRSASVVPPASSAANDAVVLGDGGDHGDVRVVLRGGADERGAADVDLLDHCRVLGAGGDGALERVEARDDQPNGGDAEAGELLRRGSGRFRSASRPAWIAGCSVFTRPSRLLGEARDLGHLGHREAGVDEGRRGGAGGDEHDARVRERPAELDQPALVAHRQQRPRDPHAVPLLTHATFSFSSMRPVATPSSTSARRRRSTGLIRSCSVASVSSGRPARAPRQRPPLRRRGKPAR